MKNVLKLSHEEIQYLKRPITSKDIEPIIKNPQRKAQEQMICW